MNYRNNVGVNMTEKQINDAMYERFMQLIDKMHNSIDFENDVVSSVDISIMFLDKTCLAQCHIIPKKARDI